MRLGIEHRADLIGEKESMGLVEEPRSHVEDVLCADESNKERARASEEQIPDAERSGAGWKHDRAQLPPWGRGHLVDGRQVSSCIKRLMNEFAIEWVGEATARDL